MKKACEREPGGDGCMGRPLLQLQLLLLTGLAVAASGCPWFRLNIVTVEEEQQLGSQLSRDVEAQIPIMVDPPTEQYISDIGSRTVEALPTEARQFQYQFQVVDSEEVNAFILPGGYVYVHRGLICFAENEAQLAAVVSHEVAHGVKRHGTERLTQAYGAQLLAEAVLGRDPPLWRAIVAEAVATVGFLSYSRTQEREADEIGVVLMHQAGWDPQGMVLFFERLMGAQNGPEGGAGATLMRWLSTHPLSAERVENTREAIDAYGLENGMMDSPEFRQIRARICS